MMKYFLLLLIFLTLGCASTEQGSSLSLSLQADPGTVLQDSVSKIHIDVSNLENKQLDNVSVAIFSPGIMRFVNEAECKKYSSLGFLRPEEFRSFSCDLRAPPIIQDSATAKIDVKASFDGNFSAVQPLELYTELEYNNRMASKGVTFKPQSYTYSDRNILLQVDFTDPLPLIVKNNRRQYVKFTIRNIGKGFINPIDSADVKIQQPTEPEPGELPLLDVINTQGEYEPCRLQEALSPIGKDFPSFSCQILMPESMNEITNYNFIIYVKYHYEIRNSVNVEIFR
jgi:hypothetical protein